VITAASHRADVVAHQRASGMPIGLTRFGRLLAWHLDQPPAQPSIR
jgi:hypothetical protein